MKVKMFSSSWSVRILEEQINSFIKLNEGEIDIMDIKMSNSIGTYVAMILYKHK